MAKFKNITIFVLAVLMFFGICAMSAGCTRGDKIVELQQQMAELQDKVSEQSNKIAELEQENYNQNGRIDELEKENKNLSDRITELELQTLKICTLSKAYDLGLLSKDDLINISYYHHGERPEIMEEGFMPVPKDPEVLSEETDVAIRQAYCRYVNPNSDKTIEDVYYSYYGTYNNCVAIRIGWHIDGYYTDYDDPFYIDGVWFSSSQWFNLMIWVNN